MRKKTIRHPSWYSFFFLEQKYTENKGYQGSLETNRKHGVSGIGWFPPRLFISFFDPAYFGRYGAFGGSISPSCLREGLMSMKWPYLLLAPVSIGTIISVFFFFLCVFTLGGEFRSWGRILSSWYHHEIISNVFCCENSQIFQATTNLLAR